MEPEPEGFNGIFYVMLILGFIGVLGFAVVVAGESMGW